MSDTADMTLLIRSTLEDFGVIKAPKLPSLDTRVKAIRERGGTVALDYQDRGCTATVGLSGNTFDAFNDAPARAVAEAFTQALLAEPKQVSLFGGDGTLPDETRSRLEELKRKREREQEQTEGEADQESPDRARYI